LARTNVATSWIFSSVLIIFGRPVCWSSSKPSLLCAKCLCHLNNNTVQGFFAVCLLHHLKFSLVDLPNFWQNLTFSCAQTTTFSISAAHRQLPFTTVTFFLNTPHAHDCFLLGWEKNGHGTISCLHVLSAAVHNCATMRPIHEIIDSAT
jgi:hypothetical protein